MIIDCHTHLNNYHEERVISLRHCLDDLQQSMADNNVDYCLILSSYKVTEHRPSTAALVDVTRDLKNVGVVAAVSYLHYKERDLREISDYLQDGLVKGLKLYPGYEPFYPHDKRLQVVYDLAMEYDVPVMIHSGDTYSPQGRVRYSHPLHIDDVAVDNPGLKLVICHLGNPWIRDCMEVVYKNTNVYTDVSGLVLGEFEDKFEKYMLQQVREMLLYAGEPGYMLYGTDWPICGMRSYIRFVNSLGLPEASLEKIMWRNASELFRIKLPGMERREPDDNLPI